MKTILREFSRAVLSALLVIVGSAGVVIASGGGGSGNASISGALSQFASTTSAQFFGVISDETGTGPVVGATGPTFGGVINGDRLVLAATAATGLTSTGNGAGAGGWFTGGSGSGIGVVATGAGGAGNFQVLSGTSSAMYAANATGGYTFHIGCDTTSPIKAPIHIDVQNAEPTGAHLVGDMYITSEGIPKMVRVSGTPGTWQSISNMGTASTVAAAGTNQATGTALATSDDWVTVTAADATKGITLSTGAVARCHRVMNQANAVLNVYGHNSDDDTINGGAADAVYAQAAKTSLVYCTANGVAWFTY